jgi:hypothetical protein
MASAARTPSKVAIVGIMAAFAAGALVSAWLLRPEAPLAFVAPGADVRLTDGHGHLLAVPRDGALRRGQRLHAGSRGARVDLARGGTMDLAPHSRLLIAEPNPRLEGGLAVIDTTTITREIRIETPSGSLVISSARVDVRAGVVLPSAEPGGAPAVAYLHVEEGRVTLEAQSRSLTLEAGEGGLLITGRPPMRQPPSAPEPVAAAPAVVEEDDLQEPPAELALAPVPVAVPVAVPVIGGSITGLVELDGAPPAEQARTRPCGGTPAWSVSGGKVENVFVRINGTVTSSASPGLSAGALAGALVPGQVALRGCAFSPRVSAFQVGQRVTFLSDGAHDVRVASGAESLFDARLWPERPPVSWTPGREGSFTLRSDDPDAVGVLAVSPHPFFAVTGSDGRFSIVGVPPGHYTVSAWHELGGTRTAEVNVLLGRASEVHFQYAVDKPVAGGEAQPSVGGVVTTTGVVPVTTGAVPTTAGVVPATAGLVPATAGVVPATTGVVAIAAAEQLDTSRPSGGECKIAVGTGSPIAQACGEGGLVQATGLMKQIVATARQRGLNLRCQGCHTDSSTHALQPTAREQLARLLFSPAVTTFAFVPLRVPPAPQPPATANQHRPARPR